MKETVYFVNSQGEKTPIDSFPFIIGSLGNVCQFHLNDSEISPIHCTIELVGDNYVLKEGQTKIGVRVNEHIINSGNQIELHNGDEVQIGRHTFYFISDSDEKEFLTETEYQELKEDYKEFTETDNYDLAQEKAEQLIQFFRRSIDRIQNELQKKRILLGIAEEINMGEALNEADDLLSNILPEEPEIISMNQTIAPDFGNFVESIEEEKEEPIIEPIEPSILVNRQKVEPEPHQPLKQRRVLSKDLFSGNGAKLKTAQKKPVLILREIVPPYEEIKVDKTPFKIGRSRELSDYQLNRKGMSRVHAVIIRNDNNDGFVIEDNESTNGTYINDSQIIRNQANLVKGDIIGFFDYEFKVIDTGEN